MRKQGSCLEKEMMQWTLPGARRRGRPRTAWMDNIKTWTGLTIEESIRMAEDRDKWRKYVHGVANHRIEDGWRTEQNRTAVGINLARPFWIWPATTLVGHTGLALAESSVGRVISYVCECLCVPVSVSALLKEDGLSCQRLRWYGCNYTIKNKGQNVEDEGHTVIKVADARCQWSMLLLRTWDCTSIRLHLVLFLS